MSDKSMSSCLLQKGAKATPTYFLARSRTLRLIIMNKILFALVLISSAALAQWDRQYFEYLDGEYSEIPFKYPSILKAEDVREIVRRIDELTGGEIADIGYLPIPGLPESSNEIQISVCSKGSRAGGSCKSGDLYLFQRTDDTWDRKGDQIGKWVY